MLADVVGMDDVKRRLELTVFNPWCSPDLTRAYGKRFLEDYSSTALRDAAKHSLHVQSLAN
jgi:hypothetical protein